MRILCGLLIATLAAALVFGQQSPSGGFRVENGNWVKGNPPKYAIPEDYHLECVRWYMTFTSPLKNGTVQLHRMGGEASEHVTKLMSERGSLTEAETRTVLDIIQISFERPDMILKPENRKPATALVLLQRLASTTENFNLKLRIADVQQTAVNSGLWTRK